jgi:hypothetical protein
MLEYLLGFLISGFSGYAFAQVLLAFYERMRTYAQVPPEDHVRWHIRRAIRKTSFGAGVLTAAIWAFVHSIY